MSLQKWVTILAVGLLCLQGVRADEDDDIDDDEVAKQEYNVAVCVFDAKYGATGKLTFRQPKEGGDTVITGTIADVNPGTHGWHIHELGIVDGEEGCKSAGSHFNPFDMEHGAPEDENRHVGDLGNFEAGEDGTVEIDVSDRLVSLSGEADVVGRSVVVHKLLDDLGRGGDPESKKTGNAGDRIGCCEIVSD